MSRRHVVITGTGRAGTTFLVQLLTKLGLDTGFTLASMHTNAVARAGLEYDLRHDNAPFVVKSPWFCDYAEEVLRRKDIVIEHVFIPMRDLRGAAESRRYVVQQVVNQSSLLKRLKYVLKPPDVAGGLWHTHRAKEQEIVLLRQIYNLNLALSDSRVPVTLLKYPRIVKDGSYLYEKLHPILDGVDQQAFELAFQETVRPDLIHGFGESDK